MYTRAKLRKFSKSKLIDITISQSEIICKLIDRLKKVEAMLRQLDNHNTPSSKKRFKKNTRDKSSSQDKTRFPGRENGHIGAGIKLPEPDKVIEHTLNQPDLRYIGKQTKTVIDFVDNPIQVTKHIIHLYEDAEGTLVFPEVDLPSGIYGKNIQAFVSLLKSKLGASHEGISEFITSIRDDLSFCPATSLSITNGIAEALASEREGILQEVRNALYCNADETGLRQDGINGYVWVFCTPTNVIYETDLSRSNEVPKRVLGENYDNIVVVDGWQGYNGYKRQRCWVKLLREGDALAEDNEEAKLQVDLLHEMYKKAIEAKKKPPDERIQFVRKMNGCTKLPHIINVLATKKGCHELASKLENARPYLFTGVIHPEVPLDNNHAERMLRKIVVHRKLMGCIRNEKGQIFIQNVMSAVQTWRLQGRNPYKQLRSFAS